MPRRSGKQIGLEDVRFHGDGSDEVEARAEAVADAAGGGDLAALDRELERLWVSDTNPAHGDPRHDGPLPEIADWRARR